MGKKPVLWLLAAAFLVGLAIMAGCVRTYQVPAMPAFANTPTATASPTATATPLVQEVNDGNFTQEVLESGIPVLVEFYATWCGHCQDFAPVMEQFAQEYAGRIKVVRVDYDTNFSLPSAYYISSLPTFIFINNGSEVARLLWPQDLTSLEAAADAILASGP
jgi:thioredoxin